MNFALNQSIKIFISSFIILIIGITTIYYINYNDLLNEHLKLSKNAAHEISVGMEQHLLEKVKTTRTIAVTPIVLQSLKKSNEHYSLLSEQIRDKEIQSKNEKWKSIKEIDNPFILKYTNNAVSKYLKNQQNNLVGEYGEIFITNKYGALIASTAKLTTLAHSHKYWWKGAYNNGAGAVFFDDRGYDKSVGGYVLGIVIPIKSDDEIIGILKVNLNILGSLSEMILNLTREDSEVIKLVRSGGLIIFEEGKEPLSERVSAKLLEKLRSGEGAVVVEENDNEWIVGISKIGITSEFSDYKFGGSFESTDHKKGNSGESWYIVDYHPISLIVKPAQEDLKILLLITFLLSVILAFTSKIIGSRAAKPIRKLIEHVELIAQGNFDSRVSVKRKDEIGFLGKSFNQMAKNLKESTTSVDKLSAEINERIKAEEALSESEKKYKSLFNSLLDAFAFHKIILDENNVPINYTFIEINDAFERQTGLKREKIIGKKVTEILPGIKNDPIAWIDVYGKVALTGKPTRFENFSKPLNKWYSIVAYSTQKGYFATIFEDITLRKQAEKVTIEKSVEQKRLFDKSEKQRIANLVVLNDLNKTTKDLKTEIIERKRSEQIQKVLYNISNAVSTTNNLKELIAFMQKELGAIIDTKNFYVALYDHKTDMLEFPFYADEKDGFSSHPAKKTLSKYVVETRKPLLANIALKEKFVEEGKLEYRGSLSKVWLGAPLKFEGKATGVIAIQSYTDEFAYNESDMEMLEFIGQQIGISIYRKKAEQDLIIAFKRAKESDRLKSAFLANMSHEIRTPMNGILGFADLLKEPNLTGEEQQTYIGVIEKSGARMLNIINDIINISKIEAGLMEVNIKKSNINEQIEYIYTFFKPEVEKKGIKFSYRKSLSSKEATLKTDSEKIYAILTNLVKNAIKYTEKGSIEFGYTKSGEYLKFYVKDTGLGIDSDRQKAIFERFIQSDISDKQALQGAGLGLAISKAYIEMLGGELWVKSEKGKGSIFYFTIPYDVGLKKVDEVINSRTDLEMKIKNLKILIVEDDEASYLLINKMLGKMYRELLHAKNGIEAIELCKNNTDIDLVFMDIKMPVMGGYEATRKIRQFNKELVIIAQTAFGLTGDREDAINSGCNEYISKPIIRNEFISLINRFF